MPLSRRIIVTLRIRISQIAERFGGEALAQICPCRRDCRLTNPYCLAVDAEQTQENISYARALNSEVCYLQFRPIRT